jgi:hypothetical protein
LPFSSFFFFFALDVDDADDDVAIEVDVIVTFRGLLYIKATFASHKDRKAKEA